MMTEQVKRKHYLKKHFYVNDFTETLSEEIWITLSIINLPSPIITIYDCKKFSYF